MFDKRAEVFEKRRNKYFKRAIKNIGKTREELKKEENNKLEEKRMIKLSGGFE